MWRFEVEQSDEWKRTFGRLQQVGRNWVDSGWIVPPAGMPRFVLLRRDLANPDNYVVYEKQGTERYLVYIYDGFRRRTHGHTVDTLTEAFALYTAWKLMGKLP